MATPNQIKVAVSGVSARKMSEFLAKPEHSHWLIRSMPSRRRSRLNTIGAIIVAIMSNELDRFKEALSRFFKNPLVRITLLPAR